MLLLPERLQALELAGTVVDENDQPIGAARVSIVQENRLCGNIGTPQEVATDDDGIFGFDSFPPARDDTVYRLMHQTILGVLPVSHIHLPSDGKMAGLTQIEVEPSHDRHIRMETVDGSPLPAKGIISVGRDKAWQTSVLRFGGDGKSSSV